MRRTRPLIAVAMHLLLLHLVFMSGARTCPMTGAASGAPAAMMHDGGHGQSLSRHEANPEKRHPAPHSSQRSHHHDACDMSCTPSGCSALGHCPTVSARSESAAAQWSVGATIITRPGHATHLAVVSLGPEPPPPKA